MSDRRIVSERWGIEIPQSASADYNDTVRKWVESSKTLKDAQDNASCACEECEASLEGQAVIATICAWLCVDCAEREGFEIPGEPDYLDDPYDDDPDFADPGGRSALRATTYGNPRNLPCPTCGEPNRLTPADRQRGYQCDHCADRAERGGY